MRFFDKSFSRLHLLALVALLASVALAYWPGRHGGFVFDDYPNIVNNSPLHVTQAVWRDWVAAMVSSPARSLPRPLAMLTFAVNHYFTGLNPVPMKLTNVAIHLLNTLLVFGLIRSLVRGCTQALPAYSSRPEWAALFVAGCWALHPINVMAVLLVVQRMESLSHTFVFTGLWLYLLGRLRQQRGEGGWALIVLGLLPLTALGVLVKESAALLPLYAFCLELCVLRFQTARQPFDRRLLVLFVLVLFLPALLAVMWLLPTALGPQAFASRDFTLVERLMTEPRVIFDYLQWTVLPDLADLSLYHDDYIVSRGVIDPPATLIAMIGLPIVIGAAFLLRRRRPLASLGLLWFLGAQVLTATFIPLELVFEHRNYFASMGICLFFADWLFVAPTVAAARRIGAILAFAAVLACAGITYLRTSEWSDAVSFAVSEVAKHPQSPRATYYLGWMLATASEYDPDSKLIEPAFAVLDQSRRLRNSNMLPDQASLVLAARTGRPLQRGWWDHMQSRLRERPIGPQEAAALGGLINCAVERRCAFPPDDMLDTFGAALSQGPNPEIFSVYGNYALNVLGDPELALRLWREAKALNPNEQQYRISAIKLLIHLGRYEDARIEIDQLRGLGRLGQYSKVADTLEVRLKQASSANH